jgi:hypothetical protein
MKISRTSLGPTALPLCAVAILLAGCGSERADTTSAPADSSAPATTPGAAGEGGDFLTAVHNAGLPIDSDDYAIAMAQGVCDMIKEDLPDDASQELVRNSEPDFTEDQVTFFISTAEQRYCPTMG